VTGVSARSQRSSSAKDDGKNDTQKKARIRCGQLNTGSNVSNVVLFFGRATVEAQMNNNHSYYHL